MPMKNLSKSKYCSGMQCHKLLWLNVNQPERAAETDAAKQKLFDTGHLVGEWAQKRFPKGVLIAQDHTDLTGAIADTVKAAAKNSVPAIFEATVSVHNTLCRADILERINGKIWDLHEVKMSASVKPEHIDDCAVQAFCFEEVGYDIRKVFLMHIDSSYVRKGDIDPHKLFIDEDVTAEVRDRLPKVKKNINAFLKIINSKICPEIEAIDQCCKPYKCGFYECCHEALPPYCVEELPRGAKKAATLRALGIEKICDIPDDFELTTIQKASFTANKTRKPVINAPAIKTCLADLLKPYFYFDFETVFPAIPAFDNSRPYQQIPFQFSLHKYDGKTIAHHEFLSGKRTDPRLELVESMLNLLGTRGSIIAYNKSFEMNIIKELATCFPRYKKQLEALLPRFWDLMTPFRSAHYVHRDFHGSHSIKYVLPVLVPDLSYKTLEIQEGGTASMQYELFLMGTINDKEWKKTATDLREYCRMDTLAMVRILEKLDGLA